MTEVRPISPGLPGAAAAASSGLRVAVWSRESTRKLARQIETRLGGREGWMVRVLVDHELRSTDALEIGAHPPDAIIACVDHAGIVDVDEFLAQVTTAAPSVPILTVLDAPSGADVIALLQRGVSDFLLSPMRTEELILRLWQHVWIAGSRTSVTDRIGEHIGLQTLIGEHPAFQSALGQLPRIARCAAAVLISGESGTGKEVFARAIHYLGPRSGHPFVPVNCGAIPETLVESELFGHRRGSFTGAFADRTGLIHEADGGTLFLDEVDSLPRLAQVKLLRFLQEGEYRPVGDATTLRGDVRVLAAASGDLSAQVHDGRFREDLYFRLNVLRIALPPLRQRRSDIPLLAAHFLAKQAQLSGEPLKTLAPASLQLMLRYDWPGNVRELENVLARAHLLCDRAVLLPGDLDLSLPPDSTDDSFGAMKARCVRQFEREYLENILRAHGGNITHAAQAAKKNRRAFWELMRKHGLCHLLR